MDSKYRAKCLRMYDLTQHNGWDDIQSMINNFVDDAMKALVNENFTTLEGVVRRQAEIDTLNKLNGRIKELVKKGESYLREEK